MRSTRTLILITIAILLNAAVSSARVEPLVRVRILDVETAAERGDVVKGRFEITSDLAGELSNFRFEGDGWTGHNLEGPSVISIGDNDTVLLGFEATPLDPEQKLRLRFDWNGRLVDQSFDLSPATFERASKPAPALRVPDSEKLPAPAFDASQPRPEPQADETLESFENDDLSKQGDVRYYGRIIFLREDGEKVGAYGATVYLTLPSGFPMLVTTTNAWGYFEFWFPAMPYRIRFAAGNAEFSVKISILDTTYSWITDTFAPPQPGTWIGELYPEGQYSPPLHQLTTATRTWAWMLGHGFDAPHTNIRWPDDRTYYNGDIHIAHPGRTWHEASVCHEYGHHWMHNFSYHHSPDYVCNGYCDPDPPDQCSHCWWCNESQWTPWMEGYPNWLADVIPRSFESAYGLPAMHIRDHEWLQNCHVDLVLHDPLYAEGFTGALLRDLEDENDPFINSNHGVYGSYEDRMSLGPGPIISLTATTWVGFPVGFLLNLLDTVADWEKPLVWETAKNCGFECDEELPPPVNNLVSISHIQGAISADPTVEFTWDQAVDDASGVEGYSYTFLPSPPSMPDTIMDRGYATWFESEPMTIPGAHYYFCIRSVDRSGKWSDQYRSTGPFILQQPDPINLAYEVRFGWNDSVLPRPASDAAPGSCPEPWWLPGDVTSTYWNVAGINEGGVGAPSNWQYHAYVDGQYVGNSTETAVPGGGTFYTINQGPIYVRGGRHTLEMRLDATNLVAEEDEEDNIYGRQWIWEPYEVPENTSLVRAAPPDRYAGMRSLPDGVPFYWNCAGLRFHSSPWWHAFAVHALDNSVDYELYMFDASLAATEGFDDPIATSIGGAGYLDWVVVNGTTAGNRDWDVGIYNSHEPSNVSYEAVHLKNEAASLMVSDSLTVTYDEDELIKLWRFWNTSEPRPISITVQSDPATPFYAYYFDEGRSYAGPFDADGYTTSYGDGLGRMDLVVSGQGYHCLLVHRHPGFGKSGPADVTIEIEITPPDFQPVIASGWQRPLVPRPANDGTPLQVDMPDTLHGNIPATYFNLAVRNNSPTDAPFLNSHIYQDGVAGWWLSWGLFPGNGVSLFNWTTPWIIPGGRHTLAILHDDGSEIEEINEENNDFGEQYCWSPLEVSIFSNVKRTIPLDRAGGWDHIADWLGSPKWFNCDGLRLPEGTGWFKAMAVMPDPDNDVDVRLHETLVGAQDGFDGSLAYSGWGLEMLDYVMVNFNQTASRPFDVGVLQVGEEWDDYTAEAAGAWSLAYYGNDWYGPFWMMSNEMLDLWQVYLPAGPVIVEITNNDGNVDWGLTLHPGDETYLTKSTVLGQATAWLNGYGQGETIGAEIPAYGPYCIAVWKTDSSSLGEAGSYRLHVYESPTATPEIADLPARTMLGAIYPNPFNPQTTIGFDLATPAHVHIDVFDAAGRHMRTLLAHPYPAGQHEATWDGRDDAGELVASGVYFVSMETEGMKEARKIVMVR